MSDFALSISMLAVGLFGGGALVVYVLRGRAGLERAQLELHVIESQLRLRGLLE
jgi:hypothetical protein